MTEPVFGPDNEGNRKKRDAIMKALPIKSTQQEITPVSKMIGAKIEGLRIALGWSHEELGKKVGLSRASIINLESGRHNLTLKNIQKFCDAFNISPKHLLRGIWF